MTDQNKKIVFISYSHADTNFVNSFASLLLDFDLQVWKDSKDIPIGGNILKSVYEGIKNTSHFCCIISSSSIKSAWVEEELSYAKIRRLQDRSLAIVPVLIEAVEIPDFLKAYRCAHLENRDMSLKNLEFIMVLQAFGVNLKEDAPRIITGPERKLLLKRCTHLRNTIVQFREWIGRFQESYERYRKAKRVSRHIWVRDYGSPRSGIGFKGSRQYRGRKAILNPAYSSYEINSSRAAATSALISLRTAASDVVASIKSLTQAGEAAGLNMSGGLGGRLSPSDEGLWISLLDALDLASGMARTISDKLDDEVAEEGEDDGHEEEDEADEDHEVDEEDREDKKDALTELWWVSEKLPRWITSIPRMEASLEGAIAMLAYWGRFDPE
ncbi:MAG: toll/interleukin-1 receptor domain-containing protein [Pyrinomonadaceae bacterium]